MIKLPGRTNEQLPYNITLRYSSDYRVVALDYLPGRDSKAAG